MILADIHLQIVRSPLTEQPALILTEDGQQYYGTAAWRRYHDLFSEPFRRYEGTLDDIRRAYAEQCHAEGLTLRETAARMGIAYRTLTKWRSAWGVSGDGACAEPELTVNIQEVEP